MLLLVLAVYELTGIGRNGELKNFEKPWAMTCIMFLGALMLLVSLLDTCAASTNESPSCSVLMTAPPQA